MITGAKITKMEINVNYTPELINITLEYKVGEDEYKDMCITMSPELVADYKVGQKLDIMLDASKWS